MIPLLRALSAESIKLRGTLALWMCLIAPGVVVALYVLQITFSTFGARTPSDPLVAWHGFSQAVLALWAFLMLPLFITLQSALLAGLEHTDNQWKHLLALPVPRRVHYLAKWLVLVGMVAAAGTILVLLVPLGGWVVMHTQPAFGLDGAPPWAFLARTSAAIFAASLLMVALHTWLAIRWRSFTVAVATGMTATVMGFLIGQSARFGHWYPWSMPVQVMASKQLHLDFVIQAGLIGGVVVTALGLLDYLRREFA